MTLKSNAEELGLIAQEIGAEVIRLVWCGGRVTGWKNVHLISTQPASVTGVSQAIPGKEANQ